MTKYNQEIEAKMQLYFSDLNQKGKRHYSAIEATKLGYGGKKYIGELLNISQSTIRMGIKELNDPILYAQIPVGKQRRLGGGRKKKELTDPELVDLLTNFIEQHKAGSPTDPTIYWIHLKPKEIAKLFEEQHGYKISNGFIKRLLRTLGFRYRKQSKTLATGESPYREAQFKVIFDLITLMSLNCPIISIDCKKKEHLGPLYRAGKVYSTAPLPAYDHDYYRLSEGKVIPHGIYDLSRNEGYISIGRYHETADFIADNLLWWWDNFGIHQYPDATSILILCDSGGGNSHRHHVFKKHMLLLAEKIGIDIIICHYPPYTSKWNPIEHRLFCHVHHAIQGAVFSDYDCVKELFAKTTTETGLKVTVRLNLKEYKIGIKTDKSEVDFDRIKFNQFVPHLSYYIAA